MNAFTNRHKTTGAYTEVNQYRPRIDTNLSVIHRRLRPEYLLKPLICHNRIVPEIDAVTVVKINP